MGPRVALTGGVRGGLRLARGTADRVVGLAGPPLGQAATSVLARLRGSRPPAPPASFAPSTRQARPTPEPSPTAGGGSTDAKPSPAVVARNIGPRRPTASAPRKRAAPKSVPGAKLPPPRPSAS
jgi:hypothetical protein